MPKSSGYNPINNFINRSFAVKGNMLTRDWIAPIYKYKGLYFIFINEIDIDAVTKATVLVINKNYDLHRLFKVKLPYRDN